MDESLMWLPVWPHTTDGSLAPPHDRIWHTWSGWLLTPFLPLSLSPSSIQMSDRDRQSSSVGLSLKFDVWTLAAAFCAIPLSRMKTSLEDAYQWAARFLVGTLRVVARRPTLGCCLRNRKRWRVATTSTHSLDGQKNSSKSDHRRILPLFRR